MLASLLCHPLSRSSKGRHERDELRPSWMIAFHAFIILHLARARCTEIEMKMLTWKFFIASCLMLSTLDVDSLFFETVSWSSLEKSWIAMRREERGNIVEKEGAEVSLMSAVTNSSGCNERLDWDWKLYWLVWFHLLLNDLPLRNSSSPR